MQEFPHHYHATAQAEADSHVAVAAGDFPEIITAPPVEFGGPGDQWSPEHLLVGTVANCFILTFRAVARHSKLDWTHLECSPVGILERVDKATRFTRFTVNAKLTGPVGTYTAMAERLLDKAVRGCLFTPFLLAVTDLVYVIVGHPCSAGGDVFDTIMP